MSNEPNSWQKHRANLQEVYMQEGYTWAEAFDKADKKAFEDCEAARKAKPKSIVQAAYDTLGEDEIERYARQTVGNASPKWLEEEAIDALAKGDFKEAANLLCKAIIATYHPPAQKLGLIQNEVLRHLHNPTVQP